MAERQTVRARVRSEALRVTERLRRISRILAMTERYRERLPEIREPANPDTFGTRAGRRRHVR